MEEKAAPVLKKGELALLVGLLTTASMLGTAALTTLPAIAPEAARAYGIPPVWIGYQFSLVSGAMLISLMLVANAGRRWGAARVIQIGIGLIGAAVALVGIPHIGVLAAASVVMGLGYGLIMPAVSHLMLRFTPRERLNLVFSLQQTGIPLGAILAATAGPRLTVAFGWRWPLVLIAVLSLAALILMQSRRAVWDDDRDPAVKVVRNPLAGVSMVLRQPKLRWMSIAGFCFSGAQFCVVTFTVVALVEQLGYGLVLAGLVLSLTQVIGMGARVLCGWLADRLQNSLLVLSGLSAIALAAGLASLPLHPGWPVALVCLLFAALGIGTVGWPGAYLAEVGRSCAPAQVATGTAGSLVFSNAGKTLAPLGFAAVYAASGSYSTAFGMVALLGGIALAALVTAQRSARIPARRASRAA